MVPAQCVMSRSLDLRQFHSTARSSCSSDRDKLSKLLDGEKQTQRQSGTNTETESQIVRQTQRQSGTNTEIESQIVRPSDSLILQQQLSESD